MRTRTARLITYSTAVVVVAGIVALAAPAVSMIAKGDSPSATPSATASAVASSVTPGADATPTIAAQPAPVTCDGMTPEHSEKTLGGYLDPNLRDTGSREGATGDVIVGDDGQLAYYVAAEGDTETAVAARFCADNNRGEVRDNGLGYLRALNEVRRGRDVYIPAVPVGECYPADLPEGMTCDDVMTEALAYTQDAYEAAEAAAYEKYRLYAGDVVNLNPHTITSVGDQNGVVYDNPIPDRPWPPQR